MDRYRYSTCVSFGTDGESDYVEHDVTVSFTCTFGRPATGPSYASGGDPAEDPEIDDIRVELIDGAKPAVGPVYLAMIVDEVERVSLLEMLASAQEDAAADHYAAMEYRAEQMREDRLSR